MKYDGFICKNEKSKKNKEVRKNILISEKNRKIKSLGDFEKYKRCGSNEFLRVLFW